MNITSCPQCGGRVRSVSIGWKCESCQGFIDMRGEFHQNKEEPFMPTITNMDMGMLIERLQNAAGGPDGIKMCQEAATALSTLQAENEKLKDQLYDGEGVNLVNYWMQQAKIEENGHRNCQAENEELRAELERMKKIMRDNGIMTIPPKYPGWPTEWNIPKPRG